MTDHHASTDVSTENATLLATTLGLEEMDEVTIDGNTIMDCRLEPKPCFQLKPEQDISVLPTGNDEIDTLLGAMATAVNDAWNEGAAKVRAAALDAFTEDLGFRAGCTIDETGQIRLGLAIHPTTTALGTVTGGD